MFISIDLRLDNDNWYCSKDAHCAEIKRQIYYCCVQWERGTLNAILIRRKKVHNNNNRAHPIMFTLYSFSDYRNENNHRIGQRDLKQWWWNEGYSVECIPKKLLFWYESKSWQQFNINWKLFQRFDIGRHGNVNTTDLNRLFSGVAAAYIEVY
jgi:hypothetical protein